MRLLRLIWFTDHVAAIVASRNCYRKDGYLKYRIRAPDDGRI